MRSVFSFASSVAVAAVSLALAGNAVAGEWEISVYGGHQSAPHSKVKVSDGPDFTAGWDGKSFAMPPYWGIRGTYWFDGGALQNWGVSLDYSHAKVYSDGATRRKAGWDHFEFTDGLNLLTLNALYEFRNQSKWTPYVGAGAGINVPHVEVTRPSGKTYGYQLTGATLQAQAGVKYQFTENWAAFGEYKGNYSFIDADIDSGANLKTNILTNAVNFGIAYKF